MSNTYRTLLYVTTVWGGDGPTLTHTTCLAECIVLLTTAFHSL